MDHISQNRKLVRCYSASPAIESATGPTTRLSLTATAAQPAVALDTEYRATNTDAFDNRSRNIDIINQGQASLDGDTENPMKISMISKLIVAALGFCFLAVAPAKASTMYYFDRTSFENSLSTSVTDDYENPGYSLSSYVSDSVMSSVLNETQYTSTGFTGVNQVFLFGNSRRYCAGCNSSFNLNFQSTSVGSADGVYGVGFDFLEMGANPDERFWASVTSGDGASVTTTNIQFPNVSGLSGFFAMTSDTLIKSIHFGLEGGGTTTSGLFAIDNLTIGSSTGSIGPSIVPVPAALPLFGTGLAILGFLGWRRKRNAEL